jgi:hypothetical protein
MARPYPELEKWLPDVNALRTLCGCWIGYSPLSKLFFIPGQVGSSLLQVTKVLKKLTFATLCEIKWIRESSNFL